MATSNTLHDRIAKLLRLAADASSPEEAAIAARRARALMDEHQLSEREVLLKSMESGETMHDELHSVGTRTCSSWRGVLGLALARLNDTRCMWAHDRGGYKALRFQGHKSDVDFTVWLYEALEENCNHLLKTERATYRGWGRRECNRFREGYASGVASKVRKILGERRAAQDAGTGSTALMVVKMQLVEAHFGRQKVRRGRSFHDRSGAFDTGKAHGHSTNFSRPVGGTGSTCLLR